MSRKVLEGWRIEPLGRLCEIRIGGTPSRAKPSYWVTDDDQGHPWVSISDLRQSRIINTAEKITSAGVKNSNVKLVQAGTVLMSFKLTIGRVSVAGTDLYTNEAIAAFVENPDLVNREFLRYVLPMSAKRTESDQAVKGKTLNKEKLSRMEILLPPIQEQRCIAEILSSVDEAIAAAQAVIEQTRKVKQSVLKRLLTTGFSHTRFKQTEIGVIPESWAVSTLESLLADVDNPMRSGPFGSALKKHELVDVGIPFLGIDNVRVERFDQNYKRFVTSSKFKELKRYAVRPGDVMITIMGTVGRCCVVPAQVGCALSSKHVWTMTFDQKRYLPELICWQLNHAPWVLDEFMRATQGGVMGAINSGVLRNLKIPVPPLEEQIRVAGVWSSFQEAITAEHDKQEQLIATKSALMSDLLTGRKRVSIDDLIAAAE